MSVRIGIGVEMWSVRGVIDPDAQAFITAAGITDATQINALNRLFKNYKGIGDLNASVDLYTLTKAFYPLVGGSATAHKFNGKNPVDSDAAYRLSFLGGWTHSSNGALPNGTNAYADTFLNPSVALAQNSAAFGGYCASMAAADRVLIGVNNGSSFIQLYPRGLGDVLYGDINDNGSTSTANTTTNLLTAVSRINSTQKIHSIGGVNFTKTNSSNGTINFNVFFGARNGSGTANSFFNTLIKFAFISDGLTTSQLTLLSTIVAAYETDLGRA